MSSFCRLCLSVQLANFLSINSEVLEKLQTCFGLQIIPSKTMPSRICYDCKDFIDKASNFRKTVISNQEKILNNILKKGELQQVTSSEKKQENEDTFENIPSKEKANAHKLEHKIHILKNEDSSNSFDDHNIDFNVQSDSVCTEIPVIKEVSSQEKFKCLTCFEKFESIIVLRNHYRHIHLIKSGKKQVIQYSVVKKDEGNLFKCDICGKSYDKKRLIVRHLLSHDENRPLICKVCGRTYKTVSEIMRHDRAHSMHKYDCAYKCGFSTAYTGALKVHEKGHRTEYKYKCDKCDRGFHVKTWYLQHQNQHTGVKPFVCNICGLAFYMDKHLQSHRNKVHIQLLKQQRFVCVHCMLPCSSKYAMKKHLKEHNITSSFLCDICGKTLSSAVQLKAHKSTHSVIRPYLCSICNKSFARKFNLKLHEVSHSGQKDHKCLHCCKSFRQKSSLTRHITGNHPATTKKCFKCEEIFISSSQREIHKKKCF